MTYYNFSVSEQKDAAVLEKPALVFIEGNHVDSSQRTHIFSRERVQKLVDNTNSFLSQGGRVPFQQDHRKDQSNNLGDIESPFYTKEITADDLPIKNHKHLIGKMGVFVDKVVAKGQKVVEDIINQNIKTLSAGIDPLREAFVEVSATPIPAIIGPALFSRSANSEDNIIYFESFFSDDAKMGADKSNVSNKGKAFSFEQLERLNQNVEELRKEYTLLSDGLFKILSDLKTSSEEELAGTNPVKASYDAIEHFEKQVEQMFSLVKEKPNNTIGAEGVPENTSPQAMTSTSRAFPTGKQPSDFKRATGKSLGFKLV